MRRNEELADSEKESRWRQRFAEYGQGGQTVSAFCEKHGVSAQSFYRWKRALGRRDRVRVESPGAPSFEEVRVIGDRGRPESEGEGEAASGHAIEVVLRCGRRIRVSPEFDAKTLSRVLAVLEGLSC